MSEEIIKIIEYITTNPNIRAIGIGVIAWYSLFFIIFVVIFIAIFRRILKAFRDFDKEDK